MSLLNFMLHSGSKADIRGNGSLLANFSIEVTPRTAAKIVDLRSLLPVGTRVYIAHIAGTPVDDMVSTARRLTDDGFHPMPHFAARNIVDAVMLETWIRRYQDEAGVTQALLLGGGNAKPDGIFHSSIQMIQTGLFDRFGFKRLHIAGHPEGNRDIDRDGSTDQVDAALEWKQDHSKRTDAEMAIVTQFAFDPGRVVAWAERIRSRGVTLPIHVGIAGPAKLQTLIQYGLSCGVGASMKVLQKRAMDVTKLLTPYQPNEMIAGIAAHRARTPESLIASAHFFPLGGIRATAEWVDRNTSDEVLAAAV